MPGPREVLEIGVPRSVRGTHCKLSAVNNSKQHSEARRSPARKSPFFFSLEVKHFKMEGFKDKPSQQNGKMNLHIPTPTFTNDQRSAILSLSITSPR